MKKLLIIEAATRTPVFVVDVGTQAHAVVPAPDESYILVANRERAALPLTRRGGP
jgi:hypothetical protein